MERVYEVHLICSENHDFGKCSGKHSIGVLEGWEVYLGSSGKLRSYVLRPKKNGMVVARKKVIAETPEAAKKHFEDWQAGN